MSSSNSTSSSNPRTILKPVNGRPPQVGDLVELEYKGVSFNTRIVDIQGLTIYLLHKKSNTISPLTWSLTTGNYVLANGESPTSIKFYESLNSDSYQYQGIGKEDKRFQFRNLEKEAKIQVLLNANQETFMSLCALPELADICVNTQDSARIYFERLKIDLDDDVYNLILNSGEVEPNLTWKEIYDRVHRLYEILALSKNKNNYINDLLFNKRLLELYLLSKLKTPIYPDFQDKAHFMKIHIIDHDDVIEFLNSVNLGMAYQGNVQKSINHDHLKLVVQRDEVLTPTNSRLQDVLPFLGNGPLRGFISVKSLGELFGIYSRINNINTEIIMFRVTPEFRRVFSPFYPPDINQNAEFFPKLHIYPVIRNFLRLLTNEERNIFNLPVSRYELLQQESYILKSSIVLAPIRRQNNNFVNVINDYGNDE